MLIAERISKSFPTRDGALTVLRDVSLKMNCGDSLALVGPSGSGKSTLLNILGTLERPTVGSLLLENVDPFSLDEKSLAEFRGTRIGFVFQEHHLLPQLSVLENVLLPTIPRKSARKSLERARELLSRVKLDARLDHRPAELSGGERQRVAIVRALINSPALVLADEPTGNLDRHTSDEVAGLLLELHRAENTALIVVTHSERLAHVLPRCVEMVDGRMVERTGSGT